MTPQIFRNERSPFRCNSRSPFVDSESKAYEVTSDYSVMNLIPNTYLVEKVDEVSEVLPSQIRNESGVIL
jgi:hypothetical protein